MKYFLPIIFFSLFISLINAKEYIMNFQGKRTTLDIHKYSDKDNFRMIKLDGTFTDKLGNYGNWTAMVYIDIRNSQIYNHGFSNHFVYQDETFTFSKGNRTNDEYKQGVGKSTFIQTSSNISKLINSSCIYSMTFLKESIFGISKCNIDSNTYDILKELKK